MRMESNNVGSHGLDARTMAAMTHIVLTMFVIGTVSCQKQDLEIVRAAGLGLDGKTAALASGP